MKIIPCIQYSPDWWEARRGIPTASNFSRIITSRGHLSKAASGYIAELIADRAALSPPFFTERSGHTEAMRNGTDLEPEARRYYVVERGLQVRRVGFITTDDGRFGCSPDALVGEKGQDVGGLELKCPELKTQAAYLLKGDLPREYKAQVHGCLVVTGLPWWDFMSYAVGLQPLLLRVEPDGFTKAMAEALEGFWTEYMAACERLGVTT